MVAAAAWVAPIVALQIVVADAYAAYFLVLWKRRGELAFPPSSAFDRAATVLCQPGNPHRKAQLALLVLRVVVTVWQLVVLVYAYSAGILHANLTGKPSNLAKFTVWNYHLQTIFWLVSATVSIRYITQQRPRVGLSQQEASIPSDAEEQCSNPSPRCGDRFLEVFPLALGSSAHRVVGGPGGVPLRRLARRVGLFGPGLCCLGLVLGVLGSSAQ